MNRYISFTYEDSLYHVDMAAYITNYIELPDGRILSVNGWYEVCPPLPTGLVETNDTNGHIPVKAVKI